MTSLPSSSLSLSSYLPKAALVSTAALASALEQIKRERAAREIERVRRDADQIRERCKTLAGFVREAWRVLEPEAVYVHNWHIDAICEHLEAITWGRMKPRLIVNISPGSSKSLIISVLWQAWMWGPCGFASRRFLSTSFAQDNVTRDTRKTRDLIQSEWYQALWPMPLVRAGETSFANEQTGSREGVAFASLMGKRGDILTIDDPHSLDGAESDAERTKAVRRFLEGGKSRVNDRQKSAIVIVMQRIHTDDLTGAILAEDIGYEHLMIPMEYEPSRSKPTAIGWTDPRSYVGELMDPRRFTESDARDEKKQTYSWNGQYQQRPHPREGNLFQVDKIATVPASPGGGVVVRGWDLAGTKRKKSAWTVGLKLRRIGGLFVIEDVKRIRGTPGEVKTLVHQTALDDGLICKQSLPKDPGQAGVAQKDDYADLMAGLNWRFTPETGDKETRALGVASTVESENLVMVKAPWNDALREEMRSFPNSSFKDQVDALSRAYSELVNKPKVEENAAPEIVEPGTIEEHKAVLAAAGVSDDNYDPWGAE